MTYTIKDKYHKLNVKLKTKLTDTSNIYLRVYRQGINTPTTIVPKTITQNDDGTKTILFEVRFKQFQIGDTITKCNILYAGTHDLHELNENISIIVDGNELSTYRVENNQTTFAVDEDNNYIKQNEIDTNRFGLILNDNSPHNVRAVYKGNAEIGVAFSDPITLVAQQDNTTGDYKLVSNIPKNYVMKYMQMPNWTWRLTRNGSPVPNKTIEKVMPVGQPFSGDTDENGQTFVKSVPLSTLAKWTPGKYTIVGNFYHYNDDTKTILTQCKNDITIVKNTPTLTFLPSSGKGGYAKFKLTDPQKQPMPNQNLILTINNKNYTRKTNTNGVISFRTNAKGAYKGQATFKGNNYYNKVITKFNQTVR